MIGSMREKQREGMGRGRGSAWGEIKSVVNHLLAGLNELWAEFGVGQWHRVCHHEASRRALIRHRMGNTLQ